MIPGNGWRAAFEYETKRNGKPVTKTICREVIYFDDDGVGWISLPNHGKSAVLMRATDARDFEEYLPPARYVAISPVQPGVLVVYKHSDGTLGKSPFGLWVLREDGEIFLADSDDHGYVERVGERDDAFAGITTPDGALPTELTEEKDAEG